MPEVPVVIVGAGGSGLSAAAALQRRGIDSIVLEQDSAPGSAWVRRYDSLHLHTVRALSGIAFHPIARRHPRYLSRDDYIGYLRNAAGHLGLQIVTNSTVRKVRRDPRSPAEWQVCGDGNEWRARVVVLATGQYRVPRMPAIPGLESYTGSLTHSANYQNASGYVGKRVLVVGAGNSGAEIATQLAEQGAAFVAMSIRTPPPIVPRDIVGVPIQGISLLLSLLPPRFADQLGRITARLVLGDLTRYGLARAQWRLYSTGHIPVIDVGFVKVLKRWLVHIRPALVRLTPTEAVYVDGRSEPFDAVVAATGFTSGLDSLLDIPAAFDAQTEPVDPDGEPTAYPGLYFIGYSHSLRGHMFEANRASRRLAANVGRYLERGRV
jgi:putative flavoprotein involved in K+ transport